jgi:co-chaperonin GroES (HSP10)
MAINFGKVFEGDLKPIHNRVIVSDMHFGEQKTQGGLILTNDDGNVRGIYPRWGKVYAKGPENEDSYDVGDWILIEHGRWTRGVNISKDKEIIELRMVEAESVLGWSKDKPDDVLIGKSSVGDFAPDSIDAGSFVNT